MAAANLRWVLKQAYLELLRHLPDAAAVNLDYFRVFGGLPNLTNPRTFSEKIQHMKLGERDPRMPLLVDKVRVKDFVSKTLGERWIIPITTLCIANGPMGKSSAKS